MFDPICTFKQSYAITWPHIVAQSNFESDFYTVAGVRLGGYHFSFMYKTNSLMVIVNLNIHFHLLFWVFFYLIFPYKMITISGVISVQALLFFRLGLPILWAMRQIQEDSKDSDNYFRPQAAFLMPSDPLHPPPFFYLVWCLSRWCISFTKFSIAS